MNDNETPNIPKHVAIIMDGNGRWAQKRGLPRSAGHLAGAQNLLRVIAAAMKSGIQIVTLYAFSTENWSRPKEEVSGLMKLIPKFFKKYQKDFMEKNIRVRTMGRIADLPDFAQEAIHDLEVKTAQNTAFTVNIALSYGGRAEITDAVNAILADPNRPERPLTEQDFASYLYAPDLPDPDLLIRTSGELRLSNFMLWQLSYTELYATQTLWPDFDENALQEALTAFASRKRRFGKVN